MAASDIHWGSEARSRVDGPRQHHQDPATEQQEHGASVSRLSGENNTQSPNEQVVVHPPDQDIPEDIDEDDDDDLVLADSDSEEVDHWVGRFLHKRVENLEPPPGCRCDSYAVTARSLPVPPPPMDPNAIKDYLYWNDNENPKPWWRPLTKCVDAACAGDVDAQCALGVKDIFTPEPPSRFGGRRQQATPEPSVWLAAAAKRSHPLALHVLAHCRSSRPFPWALPPTMPVFGAGVGSATGPMAGGNNVEAPGMLAWLRALGATGEYYAQHTLSEMYLVGCCVERHPWEALVWACRALDACKRECLLATHGLAHKWWCALATCRDDEEEANTNGGASASRARRRVHHLSRRSGCSAPHHHHH